MSKQINFIPYAPGIRKECTKFPTIEDAQPSKVKEAITEVFNSYMQDYGQAPNIMITHQRNVRTLETYLKAMDISMEVFACAGYPVRVFSVARKEEVKEEEAPRRSKIPEG